MYPVVAKINIDQLLHVQRNQWPSKVLIEGQVDGGKQEFFSRHISQMGGFACQYITGTFETLNDDNGILDDGIDHLRGQLGDTTGNKKIFDDFIPFSHWLSPGRRKSANSTTLATDDASNQLFYPIDLFYVWEKNSDIQLEVKNDSNTPISFEITFHGWRIQQKGI